MDGKVEVLPGNTVNGFEYVSKDQKERKFINTRNFLSATFQEKGFFEVLMEDEVGLYTLEKMVIKESTTLNEETGSQKDYRYEKKKSYYMWVDNDLKQLTSFSKKGLAAFESKASEMKSYIKSNKPYKQMDQRQRMDH